MLRRFCLSHHHPQLIIPTSATATTLPIILSSSKRRASSSSSFLSNSKLLFATPTFTKETEVTRNIGISAHIDSGKTTVSERFLFYTGRINAIHEVKGNDGVGATMDSMELERERGITIRSAATSCKWKDININLIDTPGHVDFTIEVERALRVLDGAIMLMCGVGAVQSQTLTVDRQMRRYSLPRLIFINKLDRDNASPQRCMEQIRERLDLHCAPLQINMGIAHDFEGIIDIIEEEAVYFDGKNGENLRREKPVPDYMKEELAAARNELIQKLADVDSEMEDLFLNEETPTKEQFKAAIRRATTATKFVPILMGSAYKNKGVQLLLDAVADYLPTPSERKNTAHEQVGTLVEEDVESASKSQQPTNQQLKDLIRWETKGSVVLQNDDEKPLIAMMFKLEQTQRVGMANYMRIYQGRIRKGDKIINVRTGASVSIPKLVKMHANSTEAVDTVAAGDICAVVGEIKASSGDTFTRSGPLGFPCTDKHKFACENMYVPPRVISMSIKAKEERQERESLSYLQHFMREDPTLYVSRNQETNEVIMEGMGELHLGVYVERLKREFFLNVDTGKPTVNYREVITKKYDYDYIFKRQSGGQGQWAHVKGRIEPLDSIDLTRERGVKNRIVLKCPNGDIREALQKSFQKYVETKIFKKGNIINAPVWGVKISLTGGAMHEVDSTDIAFRHCAQTLWDETLLKLNPTLLEPYMGVEINAPSQYLSDIQSEFARRQGVLLESNVSGPDCVIRGESALDTMFGFISDLRQLTKGQGEFSMEFKEYRTMPTFKAQEIADERNKILGRKRFEFGSE